MASAQQNPPISSWLGSDSDLARHIEVRRRQCLGAYRENPLLIQEHSNIERSTAQGGYGRRQLYELVQNGADAILEGGGSRVEVILTDQALYCANEGNPIDAPGIDSILHSSLSNKRNCEIGRFGLGFKSVLGVTSSVRFFSQTGSFGFDAEWAREKILAVVPECPRTPVLRLAFPVDAIEEAREDADLADLMSWATSVVKLPVTGDALRLLGEDIQAFPAEFVLFCSHVQSLVLVNRNSSLRREITVAEFGNDLVLQEKNSASKAVAKSRWRVFSRLHKPSPIARRDAGELAERETIPITWAVPLEGRPSSGYFWAFFPTEYETTLSGIANAPWKTNEDRQNLLKGDFNMELISATAELVVESLQELTPGHQPGAVLDYLPGRLKAGEEKNWADGAINEKVYQFAAAGRCLPDQKGILRSLDRLKVPPSDLPEEALRIWSEYGQRPTDWAHQSCETRERRSRVDRLLGAASRSRASAKEWLESLIGSSPNALASGTACQVAAVLKDATHALAGEVLQSAIVLTADGHFVRPVAGKVFLPGISPAAGTNVSFVHPTLNNFLPYRKALLQLGLTALNAKEQLTAFLRGRSPLPDADVKTFWDLASTLPVTDVIEVLRILQINPVSLRVPTLGGTLRRIDEALLPGDVVGNGKDNPHQTIDIFSYVSDALLRELGACSKPQPDRPVSLESWFSQYRQAALEAFYEELGASTSRPQVQYLVFEQSRGVGPLAVLKTLDVKAAAKFTSAVLEHSLGAWTLKHCTRERVYPSISFVNPALWTIRKHGALETSLGARRIKECAGPALKTFSSILPIAQCPVSDADQLGLPNDQGSLPQQLWTEGMKKAAELEDDEIVGQFYAAAATHYDKVPDQIRCRQRQELRLVPPSQAVAVSDRKEYTEILKHDVPAILAGEHAELLISKWKLRAPEDALKRAVHPVPVGPEQALCDKYPLLRLWAEDQVQHLSIQFCESLRLEVFQPSGRTETQLDFYFDGKKFFITASMPPADALRRIAESIQLPLSDSDVQSLIQAEMTEQQAKRREAIIAAPTPGERFLKAVGRGTIRSKLPAPLLQAVEKEHGKELRNDELFRLADAVYGVELLRVFRDELETGGLEPPVQWAGSVKAKRFVRTLGFGTAHAGFEGASREPLVHVSGPPRLPELHDFQKKITIEIQQLVRRENGSRGLLSLPTGAGKTRVAVQAIVEELRERGFGSPIVWIAQSDELCEQAVQTWTEVWRAIGARRVLSISRLWASNEADAVEDGPHVVIATIDKLRGCVDDSSYDWLSKAACVIVDEAHTAIAPEYTSVLEWLGLTRRGDRCPLLGLTATPFRGRSVEETQRLVARYGKRRLDTGALGDDPYQQLQQMGVLARVKHKLLAGISVDLSHDELAQLKSTGGIPASVRERIGADVGRNQELIRSIKELPGDWPILLFASSVSHSQTMAALLNMQGIKSAAVSAETDAAVRRYYIDEFRAGRIRALTNYGVLTQGFDAPAIRALYVARPTYSPNVYQQMIGRGLRGPKNGGKPECLIINVADNLAQYGEKLAFNQFEYLWSEAVPSR